MGLWCRLVDANETVCFEAVNEVARAGDPTAHAEIVLLRQASGLVEPGISGRALLDATPDGPEVVGPALEDEGEAALFATTEG